MHTKAWCASYVFADDPAKKRIMEAKKEGGSKDRTRQQWNDRISNTCGQARIKFFGMELNLPGSRVMGTIPLNLVQISAVNEENERADKRRKRHDKLIMLSLFVYMQICKNVQ